MNSEHVTRRAHPEPKDARVRLERFKECGTVGSSPMASTATPVSAATEQEHYQNDNQDHFHGNSPLMAMALFAAYLGIKRPLQRFVPDRRGTGCERADWSNQGDLDATYQSGPRQC